MCNIAMAAPMPRILLTLTQMLEDRGEVATKLSALSPTDIEETTAASATGAVRFDTGARDIIVFSHKPKTADITKAASETSDQRIADVILVTPEPFKKTQRTAADSAFGPHHESFAYAELMINVSRHTLVPRHEIVPRERVAEIATDSHVAQMTQFPLIRTTDAMAKYMRARPGDLVRIVRDCPTAGTQTAYRFCVK